MKHSLLLSAIAVVALSSAAHAVTINGDATANVASALGVSQTNPLRFGTFLPAATASTVTSAGFGNVIVAGNHGLFTVSGTPNSTININIPATVDLTSGANSMTATLTAPTTGSLDVNGAGSFDVQGSLAVGANQPSGLYSGQYAVTVNY